MKFFAILGLTIALTMTGCSAPQARQSPGDPATNETQKELPAAKGPMSPKAQKAFKNLMLAYYSYRFGLSAMQSKQISAADKDALKTEVGKLKDVFMQAQASLSTALGFQTSRTMNDLVIQVNKHVEKSPDQVLIPIRRGDQIASFQLVKVGRNPLLGEVRMKAGGKPFFAKVFGYDQVLVPSYGRFIAQRFGKNVGVQTVHYVGETVYVSRAALENLAKNGFFGRLDHYKKCSRDSRKVESFLGSEIGLVQALSLAKDTLRWRALKPLVIDTLELEEAERVAAFVKLFAVTEADRALVERVAGHLAQSSSTKLSGEAVSKLSWRLALKRDECLSHLATCFGLAAVQVSQKVPLSSQHLAALKTIADLRPIVMKSPKFQAAAKQYQLDTPSRQDRFVMYLLAQASVDEIRGYAQQLKADKPRDSKE